MNYKQIKNNTKFGTPAGGLGFTLFELLVSISIIAILTAIATTSFSSAQKKARDARRMQDMNAIQKAAEQYNSFSGYKYPSGTLKANWIADNGQVMLDIFPVDPKGVGWTEYKTTFTPPPTTTYCICAAMENKVGNAEKNDCTDFVNGTGIFYCVKNQQ